MQHYFRKGELVSLINIERDYTLSVFVNCVGLHVACFSPIFQFLSNQKVLHVSLTCIYIIYTYILEKLMELKLFSLFSLF